MFRTFGNAAVIILRHKPQRQRRATTHTLQVILLLRVEPKTLIFTPNNPQLTSCCYNLSAKWLLLPGTVSFVKPFTHTLQATHMGLSSSPKPQTPLLTFRLSIIHIKKFGTVSWQQLCDFLKHWIKSNPKRRADKDDVGHTSEFIEGLLPARAAAPLFALHTHQTVRRRSFSS